MEDLLQVGVITQPHGVRGEVKVFPTTDDVKRFKKLKKVLLDTGKEKIELEVQSLSLIHISMCIRDRSDVLHPLNIQSLAAASAA